MATRPKAVIESRNGEKFSPITIAKNVLTDDEQNLHDILSDRKEDMITPTIENSSSMSKVGQGDNVDFSDNVMNGAYEDVVLKGKSLVNIVDYDNREFNGNNTISNNGVITLYTTGGYSNTFLECVYLKPNTKYLAIVDVLENTLIGEENARVALTSRVGSSTIEFNEDFYISIASGVGRQYKILRTVENPNCKWSFRSFLDSNSTGGYIKYKVMMIEYQEGMENWDIPYFTGLCDVKSPILSNVGKNLINALNCSTKVGATILSKEQNCITFKAPNVWGGLVYHLYLKPNTTYTFSFEGDSVDTRGYVRYKAGMSDWSGGYGGSNKYTFTTDGLGVVMFTIESATVRDSVTVKNIMIEEATTKNLYEPYKSNTTTFTSNDDEIIVLRSLPNGVCDTLNVKTGEYVQNIGEVVLDGSEDGWGVSIGSPNTNYPTFTNNSIMQDVVNINSGNYRTLKPLCNKYSSYSQAQLFNVADSPTPAIKGIAYRWDGYGLGVRDDDRFNYDSEGLELFKQSLAQNPITVQYELAKPITKTVDISGYPYAYENGHVLLESGSQEQSLTPTIEYSIVANRGGQIRSNQRMVERHQKQLDRLQAMILTNLVNTQYEQTLTNLKYDLKNVREEVK